MNKIITTLLLLVILVACTSTPVQNTESSPKQETTTPTTAPQGASAGMQAELPDKSLDTTFDERAIVKISIESQGKVFDKLTVADDTVVQESTIFVSGQRTLSAAERDALADIIKTFNPQPEYVAQPSPGIPEGADTWKITVVREGKPLSTIVHVSGAGDDWPGDLVPLHAWINDQTRKLQADTTPADKALLVEITHESSTGMRELLLMKNGNLTVIETNASYGKTSEKSRILSATEQQEAATVLAKITSVKPNYGSAAPRSTGPSTTVTIMQGYTELHTVIKPDGETPDEFYELFGWERQQVRLVS